MFFLEPFFFCCHFQCIPINIRFVFLFISFSLALFVFVSMCMCMCVCTCTCTCTYIRVCMRVRVSILQNGFFFSFLFLHRFVTSLSLSCFFFLTLFLFVLIFSLSTSIRNPSSTELISFSCFQSSFPFLIRNFVLFRNIDLLLITEINAVVFSLTCSVCSFILFMSVTVFVKQDHIPF